jgi:hypothetical protein
MNYSKMKKDELKTLCNERKIKGISGKNKEELIEMITQRDATPVSAPKNEEKTDVSKMNYSKMNYSKKTIPELKAICKERKIKGISGKIKEELIEMITQRDDTPVLVQINKAKIDVNVEPIVKVEMTKNPKWYCIPEILPSDFIECCKPIYYVLEEKNESKSSEDPFLKVVLMGQYGMTNEQWQNAEKARIKQKVLEMKMGYFHENLMGKFPEWETLHTGHATGCDVQKKDGSVIIELKNRDNTVKGSDGKHIITCLEKHKAAGKKTIFAQINCPKGKVKRFGASADMDIWNGQQVYAFISGRESFFDDLLKTVGYVFSNCNSLAELKTALEIV